MQIGSSSWSRREVKKLYRTWWIISRHIPCGSGWSVICYGCFLKGWKNTLLPWDHGAWSISLWNDKRYHDFSRRWVVYLPCWWIEWIQCLHQNSVNWISQEVVYYIFARHSSSFSCNFVLFKHVTMFCLADVGINSEICL